MPTQVRFAHTDIGYPDFSAYRRKETLDASAKADENVDGRQSFTYLIAGGNIHTFAYFYTKRNQMISFSCYSNLYNCLSKNNIYKNVFFLLNKIAFLSFDRLCTNCFKTLHSFYLLSSSYFMKYIFNIENKY